MQNTTRQALDHFIGRYFSHMDAHQAQDSHYAAPGPKEAQARINALKSNSRLLSAINILGVANVKGRSQNFDIAGTLAATVDTNHHPRQPAQRSGSRRNTSADRPTSMQRLITRRWMPG